MGTKDAEMVRVLTCSTANVKNSLSLEKMLVVVDEVTVRISSHRILEHGFMDI